MACAGARAEEIVRLSELISAVAKTCDTGRVNQWLSAGLDPNTTALGDSLLKAAVFCKVPDQPAESDSDRCARESSDRGKLVKLLLHAGADPNQRSDLGYT